MILGSFGSTGKCCRSRDPSDPRKMLSVKGSFGSPGNALAADPSERKANLDYCVEQLRLADFLHVRIPISQILIVVFRCLVVLCFKRFLRFEGGEGTFLLTSHKDIIIDVAAGIAVLP